MRRKEKRMERMDGGIVKVSLLPPILMLECDIEKQERYIYIYNLITRWGMKSVVSGVELLGINLKGCINRARGRLMKLRL